MKDKFLDRKHELRKEFCNKFQVVSIFEKHDQYTAFLEDKVCRLEAKDFKSRQDRAKEVLSTCDRVFDEDGLLRLFRGETTLGRPLFLRSEIQSEDGNKYKIAFDFKK